MRISMIRMFACFLLLIPALADCDESRITRVIDGDTFVVTRQGVEIKIRLAGIDAPEIKKGKYKSGQPFSRKAKEYLRSMILDKTVAMRDYGKGPDRTRLAVIFVDGKNINLELVKAGLAEIYHASAPDGLNMEPYQEAQANAKKDMKGIWSLCKYMQISPKNWRESEK